MTRTNTRMTENNSFHKMKGKNNKQANKQGVNKTTTKMLEIKHITRPRHANANARVNSLTSYYPKTRLLAPIITFQSKILNDTLQWKLLRQQNKPNSLYQNSELEVNK